MQIAELSSHDITVGFISETWFNKTVDDKMSAMTGYFNFRLDRVARRGGGVCASKTVLQSLIYR